MCSFQLGIALLERVRKRVRAVEADRPWLGIGAREADVERAALPELLHEGVELGAVDGEFEAGIVVVEVHADTLGVPWRVAVEAQLQLLLRSVLDLPGAGAEL